MHLRGAKCERFGTGSGTDPATWPRARAAPVCAVCVPHRPGSVPRCGRTHRDRRPKAGRGAKRETPRAFLVNGLTELRPTRLFRDRARDMAQPGSAPLWGSGGPRFKSGCPDYVFWFEPAPLVALLPEALSFIMTLPGFVASRGPVPRTMTRCCFYGAYAVFLSGSLFDYLCRIPRSLLRANALRATCAVFARHMVCPWRTFTETR